MHFVTAALARLTGPARRRVLAIVGLAEELLEVPSARVTAESFSALWLAVAGELDDEFFGLDRRRMKVGSFALLTHAVAQCSNIGHALRLMLRGFGVLLDDLRADLVVEGRDAMIRISNLIQDPESRRFAEETFLVMVHGLMCWLAGRRIPLRSAEFAHPRPIHAGEYAVMFSSNVAFERPATVVRFDTQHLQVPVDKTDEMLKEFLRTAPQSVFLKYKNETGWTARLRRRLRKSVGQDDWPLLAEISLELHVAPTTLRRRLEAEGASYQGVKDDLRRDAAIHYLCRTELSVSEIGRALGFREPSAFYRAFKKWSGVSPGQYRTTQASDLGTR